jgi:isopentenyl-diphosphate Delta-isomerase
MDELFETYDRLGRPLGLVPRSRVHREGLWHKAANVYLFRSDGRLLIQRRHGSKDVCPGLWDLSVGEHVQPGETYEQAAVRGLREELSLCGVELESLGPVAAGCLSLPELGVRDCEFQQSFLAYSDEPVVPAESEIAEVRYVTIDSLRRRFDDRPGCFTPWFRERAAALGIVT